MSFGRAKRRDSAILKKGQGQRIKGSGVCERISGNSREKRGYRWCMFEAQKFCSVKDQKKRIRELRQSSKLATKRFFQKHIEKI